MPSSSDDTSVTSAVKQHRYRQRRQQGIPVRQIATPDEQLHLLSLPYSTLTPQQKSRVRYYRRRARQHLYQQQQSSSLSNPNDVLPSSINTSQPYLPPLLQQQQQTPLTIISYMNTQQASNITDASHIQHQAQLVASRFPSATTSTAIAPVHHQPSPSSSVSIATAISSSEPVITEPFFQHHDQQSQSLSFAPQVISSSIYPSQVIPSIPSSNSTVSVPPFPQQPPCMPNSMSSSIPSFIPVAMVPTSFFSTLFPQLHYTSVTTTPPMMSHVSQPFITTAPSQLATVTHEQVVTSGNTHTTSMTSSSSSVSSTPANILVDMALTRASQTSSTMPIPHNTTTTPIVDTSSSDIKHDDIHDSPVDQITTSSSTISASSSISSSVNKLLDDIFKESSYLVHPYDQVQIQQSHELPHVSAIQSSTTSKQQWKTQHDYIHNLILLPRQRHKRMVHVTSGKYISVMDVDIKQDTYPNPQQNIIQEMLGRSISSPSVTAAQQLKQILPLSMTTHTHPSYSQQSIPTSHPPPTFKLTTLKQSEAYERIIFASTSSSATPDKHIFTPSINIHCIKDLAIKQRLTDIARAVQQQYKQCTSRKHEEVECEEVFTSPLDGFGISGLQVYIKSGECITWLHDELLWCAALNYMLKESQGCALWIAVGMHELKQHMSLDEIEKLLLLSDLDKQNIMEVGTLLDTLIQSGTHIEYVFQYPGQLVASPPGNGSAHFVFSYGTLMTQVAWDYSFTIPGAVQCLSFWGINDEHDHYATGNTSMSSISVLPLYTMQLQGYQLGLMDQVQQLQQLIIKLKSIKPKTRIKHDPSISHTLCPKCLYRQDWLRINNQCIHCYFRHPKIIKLLK